MKFIILHLTTLLCVVAQRYHYNKPHFHRDTSAAVAISPNQPFVVRTLGPHSREYKLQLLKSKQIYLGKVKSIDYVTPPPLQQQLPYTTANTNPLLPPKSQGLSSITAHSPVAEAVTQPPRVHQIHGPPAQQNYGIPAVASPPPVELHRAHEIYGPPVQQTYGVPSAVSPHPVQQSDEPLASVPRATNPISPLLNPQPYATVQLPNGQRVLDGGHGAGARHSRYAEEIVNGQQQQQARIGDYYSQSQASQLDYYPYKQTQLGDARDFQRYVVSCQANGQCQSITVHPGQNDPAHQQFLGATRVRTVPGQDLCHQFAAERSAQSTIFQRAKQDASQKSSAGGTETNEQGLQRPGNRRFFEYTETIILRDPYN